MAHCSACQAELASQQRLWEFLGCAEPIRPPDVFAAVEARLAKRRGWDWLLAGLRPRLVGYAAVAAVLVGVFVWAGVWAGSARRLPEALQHDRALAELLSNAPPGMEIVALLDEIGERP